MVVLTINHCHASPQRVETAIDVRGTKGFHCLGSNHLPWTVGLRVTGAYYRWFPQCCPCLIDEWDPGIPNEGDDTERMGPI